MVVMLVKAYPNQLQNVLLSNAVDAYNTCQALGSHIVIDTQILSVKTM